MAKLALYLSKEDQKSQEKSAKTQAKTYANMWIRCTRDHILIYLISRSKHVLFLTQSEGTATLLFFFEPIYYRHTSGPQKQVGIVRSFSPREKQVLK